MLTPEQIACIERCARDEESQIALRKLFLESQNSFYQTMVEQHSDLICRCQPDATVRYANAAFSAFVQQPAGAIVGQNLIDLLYGDDEHQAVRETWRSSLAKAPQPNDYEHQLQRADGKLRWIHWSWQPVCDADDKVIEIRLLGQDVSELKESDAALLGSIAQYRQLIEASPDGIYISIGSVIYYANPVMAAMIGAQSPEQLVGMTIYNLLHPSYHAEVREHIAATGEDSSHIEQRQEKFLRLDGTAFDVEVSLSNVEIDNAPATVVFVRDISVRKKSQQNQEKFYAQLMNLHQLSVDLAKIESLDELCRQAVEEGRDKLGFDRMSIWLLSSDLRQMIGTYGTDALGRTLDERHVRYNVAEGTLPEWLSEESPMVFQEHHELRDAVSNKLGEGWVAQVALMRGDEVIGTIYTDNLLNQEPPSYRQLDILKLYGVTISTLVSRLRAAREREQSDARYRAVFESARFGISITNAEGFSISANSRLRDMLGYDAETLGQIRFFDYTHPDDRETDLTLFNEMLHGERTYYQIVTRFIRRDGSIFPVRLTVTPFPRNQNEEPLVLAMIEDITDQAESQSRLLESEARHRAMLEAVPDMFFRFNAEGIYQDCHVPDPSLLIRPLRDQIGKHYREVLPPDLAEITDKYFKLAQTTSETQTFIAPLELHGRLYHFENRIVAYDANQVLVVVRDMSERIEAMKQLSESEERFRQFAENIDEVIYLIDAVNDQVLYINEAFERLWQHPRSELYKDIQSYTNRVHPEDVEIVRQVSLLNPNGTEIEFRIVLPDGQTRWMWTRNFPILNEDGVVHRVAGVTKDVTERKEMESTKFRIAVQQERMKLLSDFVRDISHAFRTPLSLIASKLYLVRRAETVEDQQRHLDGIQEQAEHILKLVESLVTMIRLDSGVEFDTAAVNTYDLVMALEDVYHDQANAAGIKFMVDANPALPPIQGNVEELNMAFSQLVINALQHSAAGDTITIGNTRRNDLEIAIVIQDTGSGISREALPRIFDRFFRSSDSQNVPGFGLGLPIVERILEGHKGRITVESEPGLGSTFTVILPLAPANEH